MIKSPSDRSIIATLVLAVIGLVSLVGWLLWIVYTIGWAAIQEFWQ